MWDNQARGSAANRGEGQLEGEGALRDERREGGGDASASDGGEVEADEVERVRFVGGLVSSVSVFSNTNMEQTLVLFWSHFEFI